jgi:hypothetical protein
MMEGFEWIQPFLDTYGVVNEKTPLKILLETSLVELHAVLGPPLVNGGFMNYYTKFSDINLRGKWVIFELTAKIDAIKAGQCAIVTVMIDPTGFRSDEDAIMFKLRSL